MTKRVHNFNPGPAVLPMEVLQQAQAEMLDYRAMNEEVAKERAVLIQKILGAKKEGGGERRPERPKRNYSCHEEDYSGKEGY